jgi:hypothetical protein
MVLKQLEREGKQGREVEQGIERQKGGDISRMKSSSPFNLRTMRVLVAHARKANLSWCDDIGSRLNARQA